MKLEVVERKGGKSGRTYAPSRYRRLLYSPKENALFRSAVLANTMPGTLAAGFSSFGAALPSEFRSRTSPPHSRIARNPDVAGASERA